MKLESVDYQDVSIPKTLLLSCLAVSALAVAFLLWLIYGRESTSGQDVSFLAPVNASLNALSASCLALGYRAIRAKNWQLHRNLMLAALGFSSLFLVSYIIYHALHGDSKFLGEGFIRPVYFSILISHIVLSIVALPLVLISVALSLTKRFSHHKKWARWTFPVWSYVSATGVVIFFMLKIFGSTSGAQ